MKSALNTLVLALALLGAAPPGDARSLLLLKVLAYDRTVAARAGESVDIAVLFLPDHAESRADASAFVDALNQGAARFSVAGHRVKARVQPYAGEAALTAALSASKPVVLWVGPGLDAEVPAITRVSRKLSINTFTGTEAMVRAGVGVALLDRGGKAGVLVNLPATRAESSSYDADLLKVVEVIR